ncbi:MAG TPA: prepilin-type N-terminal cleavage/methylation domain-containing protein [Candidatus Hydrothermia bacterium]|mgnify:CR=1 FL=1|nr:prepilin-type N-terminal cleavage/methylation domain-containing protein [Candidatus Hydrothermia bacterium]MDD5572747.1 prepilin-type N-terminal cleavage/methylation domain-containing protein [Candidatus Hydrothermia bacterium]HOK23130.1 prepilin-type N-terminal cleavage/methylation domain-containing protein [Candidatus Hydrothermia bacterium]HOL23834.1 prepilin-type N-terminal cleavage/methylation domain-containing protein [Candidatus Hydrothermia bacterium]HOP31908.1 prepilin-type N-termin
MKKSKGYTLIEILVAFSLLSIGLMGIIPLSLTTIRLNSFQNQMLNARYLAERHSEFLRGVSFNAPELANDGNNEDLDDVAQPDHAIVSVIDNVQYTTMWNIVENADGTRTVMIIVRWFDARAHTWRDYRLTTVKSQFEL